MFVKRFGMMKRLMDQAGEGGEGGGGTDDAAAKAAADAAAKAAADAAAAAAKAAEDAAKGGKGGPTDEEARLLKENMKRKEDLKTANEALTKAQAQLKAFEGIDPEAVRKMLADQKTAEEKGLEAKGDWERLKTRMAEEHTRTLTEQTTKLTDAEQKLKAALDTINELSIGTLFGQSKFISDELTLTPAKAKMIYASHFDLEDGKVVGYDKPRGSAGRTAQVDAYGNPVDFETAMKKIIEADPEKDYLTKSKMKPGAGSDSKKMDVKPQQGEKSGLDKIAAGLKDLKIAV